MSVAASWSLNSPKERAPTERQKRVTDGWLTPARRASSAMVRRVAASKSWRTVSATRRSAGLSSASTRSMRETMSMVEGAPASDPRGARRGVSLTSGDVMAPEIAAGAA